MIKLEQLWQNPAQDSILEASLLEIVPVLQTFYLLCQPNELGNLLALPPTSYLPPHTMGPNELKNEGYLGMAKNEGEMA